MKDSSFNTSKEMQTTVNGNYPQGPQTYVKTTYYVTSSVLGGRVVTEVADNEGKIRTYTYANGEAIAWHIDYTLNNGTHQGLVEWNISDPVTGTRFETSTGGSVNRQAETDAIAVDVGLYDPNILAS